MANQQYFTKRLRNGEGMVNVGVRMTSELKVILVSNALDSGLPLGVYIRRELERLYLHK